MIMAESSAGGPPLPPKRPTIIRASVKPSLSTNGDDNKPVPARPVPPVPGSRPSPTVPHHSTKPPVPQHPTNKHHHHLNKINDGGAPHLPDTVQQPPPKPEHKPANRTSVRKRPEITVVAARPMSEVGFRSDNPAPAVPSRPPSLHNTSTLSEDPPPLPKRDSSLEPEVKSPPTRPNPPVPNKPLPPAPSSRPKFPLRPSQPAKPKYPAKSEPEEGLLIDFSDVVEVPLHPPLIPSPGSDMKDSKSSSSSTSPTYPSPPAVPSSLDISNKAVPLAPPDSVPKSSRPVPAARSSTAVNHSPSLPDKPQIPTVKPRTTPDTEKQPDLPDIETETVQDKPKRPTIIRPKRSQEPSTEAQDDSSKHLSTRPKPLTPTAAKRSTIADIPLSTITQEVPEYAAIIRPKNKSVSQPEEEESIADPEPPPIPVKNFHPATAPKPTVLPKPRQSLISAQNDIPSEAENQTKPESKQESKPESKPEKNKIKPTIIRPPPKPLRLHEVEANNAADMETKPEEPNEENKPDRPPRPVSRVQVLPTNVPPKPPPPKSLLKPSVETQDNQEIPKDEMNPFEDSEEHGSNVENKMIEKGSKPARPKPPTPKMKPKSETNQNEENEVKQKENESICSERMEEKGPTRPKPPSPKHRTSTAEQAVEKRPSRPGGPPPRPASAAPSFTMPTEREKPSRPQPPRPGPPMKKEKPSEPPSLPPRPTPSHALYHYILTYPHGIAQYDYTANNHDEISFKEGEVIILTGRFDSEWLKGKIGQIEGIFPENFIEIIHPLHSEYPAATMESSDSGRNLMNPDWGDETDDRKPDSSPSPSHGSTSSQDPTSPNWGDDSVDCKPDTGSGPRCRARFDFDGEGEGDLEFEEGDVIKILKHIGSDWLQGELNNKVGIFPLSFVEIIEDVSMEDQTVLDTSVDHFATTVFDFEGLEGELSFQAGETIHVLSEVNSEWLYGEIDDRQGKFPHTFIDKIPLNLPKYSPPEEQNTPLDSSNTQSVLYTCTALYDYDSSQVEDLCFNAGDHIEVIEEMGDWLKGRLNTRVGIFPKSFIQIDNACSNESPSNSENQQLGKALFDFIGENDKELSFKKDDIITLGERVAGCSDWQHGDLDGKHGIFPVNFITVLD